MQKGWSTPAEFIHERVEHYKRAKEEGLPIFSVERLQKVDVEIEGTDDELVLLIQAVERCSYEIAFIVAYELLNEFRHLEP